LQHLRDKIQLRKPEEVMLAEPEAGFWDRHSSEACAVLRGRGPERTCKLCHSVQ